MHHQRQVRFPTHLFKLLINFNFNSIVLWYSDGGFWLGVYITLILLKTCDPRILKQRASIHSDVFKGDFWLSGPEM